MESQRTELHRLGKRILQGRGFMLHCCRLLFLFFTSLARLLLPRIAGTESKSPVPVPSGTLRQCAFSSTGMWRRRYGGAMLGAFEALAFCWKTWPSEHVAVEIPQEGPRGRGRGRDVEQLESVRKQQLAREGIAVGANVPIS